MRIWIGKELEGRYAGVQTMFIESDIIDMRTIRIITDALEYALNYTTIGALYFGAGRKNVKSISKDCIDTLQELKERYILSIEFDKDGTDAPNLFEFDNNVFRIMCEPLDYNNLSIKIDTNLEVFSQSIDCMFKTDLNTLNDHMFLGTDRLIYKTIKED